MYLKMDHGNRNRVYFVISWLLVGLLLLLVVLFSYKDGFKSVSVTPKKNGVYEISRDTIESGSSIDGSHYELRFWVWLGHDNENYLRIKTSGIDNNATKLTVIGTNYGKNDEIITTLSIEDEKLSNGDNYYKLPTRDFIYVAIFVDGMEKKVVDDVQFRESVKEAPIDGSAVAVLGITTLVYLLISAIAYKLYKNKRRASTNTAEAGVLVYTNEKRIQNIDNVHLPISEKKAATIIAVFSLIIVFSFLFNMAVGEAGYNNYYKYYVSVQLGLVLVVAAIAYTNKCMNKVRVDGQALITCASLAMYMLISDIFVEKVYRFSGICVFAVLLTYAIFILKGCFKDKYVNFFRIAVNAFFIVLLILSFFCKEQIDDGRFSGPLSNASIYALYLGSIWAILIGTLETQIFSKERLLLKVATLLEMAIVVALSVASQSLTPVVAMTVVAAVFVFRTIHKKMGPKVAVASLLLSGAVLATVALCILLYARKNGADTEIRILDKIASGSTTTLFSSRDYYWREYLRHMNLLGHSKKPYLWDHRILPHNALIGMMYWYGVPCIIPYIIMIIMSIEKSIRYANTGAKYSEIPFYSTLSFVIMSMADNVEQPFIWLPWIACYLLMAPILFMPMEDINMNNKAVDK